jgi:hypothetical protein
MPQRQHWALVVLHWQQVVVPAQQHAHAAGKQASS